MNLLHGAVKKAKCQLEETILSWGEGPRRVTPGLSVERHYEVIKAFDLATFNKLFILKIFKSIKVDRKIE